jgi:hypothetical protein
MAKMLIPTFVGIAAVMLFPFIPSVNAQESPSEQDLETYQVTYEEHTFEVKAALSNDGTISGMELVPEVASILLTLEAGSEDGELTIILPRDLIDSKDEGVDDEFFIVVDGFDVEPEEILTTETERALKFPVPADAIEVEIFGSQVIPEFPLGLLIASSATIGLVPLLHRIRHLF